MVWELYRTPQEFEILNNCEIHLHFSVISNLHTLQDLEITASHTEAEVTNKLAGNSPGRDAIL